MKQPFLYGSVLKLTREDDAASISRHFKTMKESGMDTVVIWPAFFWWERQEEGYPFNTGRLVLDLAQEQGIRVVMELAGQLPTMEYLPDFEMKDDYYCLDDKGHPKRKHASFGVLNYFHPEVHRLICGHLADAANAYKDHPALLAYDVFNETAFNSYDPYTLAEFRCWLREKYGTVEHLNDVWEHCYTDFSQVSFDPWMWMSVMPSADFAAFRKASVGIILKRWCAAIRAVDGSHPLWADNIGSMICNGSSVFERPQEDFLLKEAVDEIGMSFYPKQVSGTRPPDWRWNTFDAYFAASKREGFYVAEMQTHIQAMFNPTTCVRPYELKQWCYEAVAGGAKGLIYWMWRPFTKGLQTAGRGLVDYKGRSTPRLELARAFGEKMQEIGTVKPLRAKVGILFDGACQDMQAYYTKCYKVDQNIYLSSLCGAYKAMYDVGVRADIVRLHEIGAYPVLLLSNHIVIGKETAKALIAYLEKGGVILCDGKIGMVDELSMLNGDLPGGELNRAMGQEFIDTDYEQLDFDCEGVAYKGYYGRDLTALTDGEAIGSFADGTPAVVRKRVGKGELISVNTYLWYGYKMGENDADRFATMLAERYCLRDVTVSGALKVRVSERADALFAFVFNYTDLEQEGRLCGLGFDQTVKVAPGDVLILKKEKNA